MYILRLKFSRNSCFKSFGDKKPMTDTGSVDWKYLISDLHVGDLSHRSEFSQTETKCDCGSNSNDQAAFLG